MQLVKNTFLKNERTISRKMLEIVLALALERTMSKWEIFSSYTSKVKYVSSFKRHPTSSGSFSLTQLFFFFFNTSCCLRLVSSVYIIEIERINIDPKVKLLSKSPRRVFKFQQL